MPAGSGGGLRHTYAAFLDEASQAFGDRRAGDRLAGAAAAYRAAAAVWTELARQALPDDVAPLAHARRSIDDVNDLLVAGGDDNATAIARAQAEANEARAAQTPNSRCRARRSTISSRIWAPP